MFKVSLGVLDIPYTDKHGEIYPHAIKDNGQVETTFEVANKLEKNYGIIGFFIENNGQLVADEAVQSYIDHISGLSQASGTQFLSDSEARFRDMLNRKEMDGKRKGVPTKAAMMGVSHRFKSKSKGKSRPSFIDTGLYQQCFHAWIDL